MIISRLDSFFPELAPAVVELIRMSYGILLSLFLITLIPHVRRFFFTEKRGGYIERGFIRDAVFSPAVMVPVLAVWYGCAIALVLGWRPVFVSAVNVLICYLFFIQIRWKSLTRGFGAPGFITYWLGVAVFLLQYAVHRAPKLTGLILLTLQIDFAVIILMAGIYKIVSGFPVNRGMETGLANPAWSYGWRLYKKESPKSFLFILLNQLSWITEITAALLMLIPATRFLGASILMMVFLFLASQLRLGVLCEMVMVICLIYFSPSSAGGQFLQSILPAVAYPAADGAGIFEAFSSVLFALLSVYLFALPFAYGGMAYNFYKRKPLGAGLQPSLHMYTNFFGMILWRVFSADIVQFFVRVYAKKADGEKKLLSNYGFSGGLRFSHVVECISLTNVFTALQYYPKKPDIFTNRLLRYAKSFPDSAGSVMIFEYVRIVKAATFEFVPVCEYHVDTLLGTVQKVELSAPPQSSEKSAVHECEMPGSYAPV